MKKDVSQYLPCEKFIVKKLLSQGSYGIVYLAYSHIRHQTVAVKVEKNPRGFNQNSSNLQREIVNLIALNGVQGIPQVLDFDCETSQFSYFSMQMFGKDFSQLLKKCNNMFSHKTVLMIASQVVNILKQIHEKGYIHRDIKPENLVLGSGQNRNKVYIIDFGTAKPFIDKTTKQHVSFQEKQSFVGTYRYAAKAPHFGYEQGRKDDLESLGYVLIYLCKGRLPWQDLREFNQEIPSHQQQTIGQMKKDTPIADLCEGLPSFFHWFLNYVNELQFEEEPDYVLIQDKINYCIQEELKQYNDNEFDWSALSMNQSYLALSNQDVNSMISSINNYNSANSNYNQFNILGLQSSNLLGQNNLNANNNNNLNVPPSEKQINANPQPQRSQNSQRLKTFLKSKSAGVQNTHVQSFEENYSRQVHCEDFVIDYDEDSEDHLIEKTLVKQLPYQFQPRIRQKLLSQQLIKNEKCSSQYKKNNNNERNQTNYQQSDFYDISQFETNNPDEFQDDAQYNSRNYSRSNNEAINNTNQMLQNMSINIPTTAKFSANLKKQYVNEPIQEDNLTQENTQTVESYIINQDERSYHNNLTNGIMHNSCIYTSKQPKFISQQKYIKEQKMNKKSENNQNTLNVQLN